MSNDKDAVLNFLFKKQLPTLPTMFTEFNKLMHSPYVSSKQVADLIMKDQSMVVKILKLSNSAMYGKQAEIKSLSAAITYLGMETLRNIILQIVLIRMFDFKHQKIPDLKPVVFWHHSIATAYFADIMERKLKLKHSEGYYIGGLLHDIGKVLLYQYYPQKFEEIILMQIDDGVPDYEAEKEVLGVDHAEIGGYLAENWKFGREIIEAIRCHHLAKKQNVNAVTAVVSICNLLSKKAGLCFPWDEKSFDLKSHPGWALLSEQGKMTIDVDQTILMLSEEIDAVKEAVLALLH
ncbi:MAG: HDOD domain-containing protein [Candidatus Omnitrophota bacterium]